MSESARTAGARAVYNLDKDLRFLSANDTALRYWNKPWSEIVGRRMLDAFPRAAGSEPYEAHLWTLRSFRPFRGTVESPVLGQTIDLEIHPNAEGLQVSFAKCAKRPQRG